MDLFLSLPCQTLLGREVTVWCEFYISSFRFSLCDFPLHLPLELLGVDLALQVPFNLNIEQLVFGFNLGSNIDYVGDEGYLPFC